MMKLLVSLKNSAKEEIFVGTLAEADNKKIYFEYDLDFPHNNNKISMYPSNK